MSLAADRTRERWIASIADSKENLNQTVPDEGLRRIEFDDPTVKAIKNQMKEYDKKVENR